MIGVEVACDILVGGVEEKCGIQGVSAKAGLKVKVRTRGTSRVATQADRLTSLDIFVGADELLRHVAVVGLQTIRVTDHDIFAIATGVIPHNAHLARPCGTDGVADIDFDIKTLVSATPTATKITSDDTTGRRHVEASEIDTVFIGEDTRDMYAGVAPRVVQVACWHLCILFHSQTVENHCVNTCRTAIDGCLTSKQVLSRCVMAGECHDCCYCECPYYLSKIHFLFLSLFCNDCARKRRSSIPKRQGKARNAFSKTQKHDCKGNKKISKRLRRKPIL